jgi:hypothetical protein
MSLSNLTRHKAQAALEYLILLTVVAVVIFVAIKPSTTSNPSLLNKAQHSSELYYNQVTEVIMGKNPNPINGGWCAPKPNGECECACPAPAFGGLYCVSNGTCTAAAGAAIRYCGDGYCDPGVETGEAGHPRNAGDRLTTCFEDCAFVTGCERCLNRVPSVTCGGTCGTDTCRADQVCMRSDCGNACPNYQAPVCQSNSLLCTSSCRCDPSRTVQVGQCGGLNGMCGSYPIGPTEKCFRYTSCTGACSVAETYVATETADCMHCNQNGQDADETGVNCGGSCQSCCGNGGPLDAGEQCDDGNRTNGDGCSSNCLREDWCVPPGAFTSCKRAFVGSQFCCGEATPGRNGLRSCSIARACDAGETQANCPEDCTPCTPNGNCVPLGGVYSCGDPTPGVSENCPTIPCEIPQQCDQGESCSTCPDDCETGACIATGAPMCGAPTPGVYEICGTPCEIPTGCDSLTECATCPGDCGGPCVCTSGDNTMNASPCPGAWTGLTSSLPFRVVSTCPTDGSEKCTYRCNTGFRALNGSCVLEGADCTSRTFNTGPCGDITLPATNNGEISIANCPGGCSGTRNAECFNGDYPYIHGACGPVVCPASTYVNPTCGTSYWDPSPVTNSVYGSCGEKCDGLQVRNCFSSGQWSGAFTVVGGWGCRPKPRDACIATTYTTPCGGEVVDIPVIEAGQATTIACPGGCKGGTITASCLDGSTNGGLPTVRNNCHHCGDGIKDAAEVCDSNYLACTAPSTGSQLCLPDCSGYGPCLPDSCLDMEVSAGTCGPLTLPGVPSGETSRVACPPGCSGGEITAVCSGRTFTVSGSCTPNACVATPVTIPGCGTATLAATTSGNYSTINPCPGGCPGSVRSTCLNGNFGTLEGACAPRTCTATTVGQPYSQCGNVAIPETNSGSDGIGVCRAGCTGGITRRCNNGVWGTPQGSCAPTGCARTLVSTTCGDAYLEPRSSGGNQTVACPGCQGTVTASCTEGRYCIGIDCVQSGSGVLEDETSCRYACAEMNYIFANTCSVVPIPGANLNQTVPGLTCPSGCTGSISARCTSTGFVVTQNCTESGCLEQSVAGSVPQIPPVAVEPCNVLFPASSNNQQRTVNCSTAGCSGSLTATCQRGEFRSITGSCSPCLALDGVCRTGENPTNCPNECGCDNDTICENARGESGSNCPGDCRCQATTLNTLCDLNNPIPIPETPAGGTGTFDCSLRGCAPGIASVPCNSDATWGAPTAQCFPRMCPTQSGGTGTGDCAISYNITAGIVGEHKPIGCGVLCTGTRELVCQSDLTWQLSGSCSPIQCPPASIPFPTCSSDTLELPLGEAGDSQGPLTCPAGCTGTITYACGVSGTWGRVAGGCS